MGIEKLVGGDASTVGQPAADLPADRVVFEAEVARDATALEELVPVIVPSVSTEQMFGPCAWAPYVTTDGVFYPKRGDEAWIIREGSEEVIVAWEPSSETADDEFTGGVGITLPIDQSDVDGLPAALAAKANAADVATDAELATHAAQTSGVHGLDNKAPLASPALTGTPTTPTAAGGTNTTQIASTAFVKNAVDAIVAGAPGALDTLDELAAALGDDANAIATLTTLIGTKAAKASNLSDLADVSVARTNLGLGSLAVLSTINGANWSGQDLAVADGGTGASTAAGARTNLGLAIGSDVAAGVHLHVAADIADLGSMALQAASAVAITGGSIAGITDLAVADGGTGASSASAARSNLGLAIGTDVAPVASPAFTGNPTAPTPAAGDDDTSVATTAFVQEVGRETLSLVSTKAPVLAATAAALPAYSVSTNGDGRTVLTLGSPPVFDGIIMSANSRGLVKNETAGNAKYNGIYEVTDYATGQLTRADDFASSEAIEHTIVNVISGTANAGRRYYLSSGVVLDTDALTFSEWPFAAPYLLHSVADAKGDLIAATGPDAFARVAVGTDGKAVIADSSQASGIGYREPRDNAYRTVQERMGYIAPATNAASAFILNEEYAAAAVATGNAGYRAFYIAPDDFVSISGKARFKLRASGRLHGTAQPGQSVTMHLYPITTPAMNGTSLVFSSIGASVLSAPAITLTTASRIQTAITAAEVTLSAGAYLIGFVTSGATAANSQMAFDAQLLVREIA